MIASFARVRRALLGGGARVGPLRSDNPPLPARGCFSMQSYNLQEAVELAALNEVGRGKLAIRTLGLDEALGDIRDDDFIVITARGGTGKTWLMLQMAIDAAAEGTPTAFFSGEMSVADIAETRLTRMFEATRHIPKDAPPSVKIEAAKKLPLFPIHFPDITTRWPFRESCIPVMDEFRAKGVKLFFFDHLRFFVNNLQGRFDERLAIEQTILDMRLYAKANKTPIVLAVQPRQIHSDEEATIDTLKGSSAISQDATNVLVLDRPRKKKSSMRNDEDGSTVVYEPYIILKVEKARHAIGNARLKLYLDYQNGRLLEWGKGGQDLWSQREAHSFTTPL